MPRSSTPPRRSRARSSTSAPSYGLFIDGEFVDGRRRRGVQDDQPGHRGGARRGHRRRAPPTSTAPSRPPARAYERVWGRMPGADRGKYLFRIARHPAGAGPRVRRPGDARQRQADPGVPRRRHPAGRGALLLPRGLGRQARVRRPRARPAAARRRRPGHPVELPAADAGVEDRARRWPPATPSSSSRPRPRR